MFYNSPVQPGDAMSASVVSQGNGTFQLTLSDATAGWTQTTQQSEPNAQLGSAEIIAEAPSNGQQVLPLANFGTVGFSNASVDNQALGGANPAAITMGAGGTTLATPSALTGGNTFTVTWDAPAANAGAGNGNAGAGDGNGAGIGADTSGDPWWNQGY